MNASEVLKGFAMKQVYSYLDKDPEANLPNLLDMLEKYDKNGQAVTTQVEGIRAALSDPNNNWSKLVKSLWTDIDDEQRKKLVETVVINRKYPDALILTVTECTASAALTGENGTWLMSDEGKILERASQIPEGCARVTGCTLVEPAVGAMAAFADGDSYKFERLLTLLRTAEDKQLLSMIGEIDLSDGTAITFTYLDRFTVKMPWDADIAYKLGNVRTVVEQLEANQTGTINLMNDGRADFIPE